MASTLVAAYEQLLLDNVSTVTTVESTIRNVTWFLPGRFADGDIASEGLYALLSVVSSVHDVLLEKRIPPALSLPPHPFVASGTPARAPEPSLFGAPPPPPPSRVTPLLPAPSEHTRYTRYWTTRSPAYRRAARALTTLTYVELLLEMVAKKRVSERARWRLVLGIESFKTVLRLILLLITRRPLVWPPTPQREYDVALIPQDKMLSRKKHGHKAHHPHHYPSAPEAKTQPNTVPVVNTLRPAPLRSHLYPLAAALPEDCLPHPLSLVPELVGPTELLAELFNATAVLVQVVLLVRVARRSSPGTYRRGSLPTLSRAMGPFIIPIALQLLARRLRASPGDSTLLAESYAQRDRRTASRFFLQGPMWIGWTRPKIVGVIRFLEKIPLIGLAGELINGYLPLADEFFYTAAS